VKRSIETRSFPNLLVAAPRDLTFYVADPISSIETRSLPTLTRSYPRRFTFYVADPISSIRAPVTTPKAFASRRQRYRAELEQRIVERATRIQDQTIVKFMHRNRLTIDQIYRACIRHLPQPSLLNTDPGTSRRGPKFVCFSGNLRQLSRLLR
jgi:hypothetical protein